MGTKILVGGKLLAALAMSVAATAQAVPINFSTAQYDTSVFAFSGALADAQSASSPSPLPLISSATVTPANDFATASAIAAAGLLVASSEADSFTGSSGASAGAQSHFNATVLGSGRLHLNLSFDDLNAIGGGTGSGTLFVEVTNTLGGITSTLFNGFYDASTVASLEWFAPGSTSTVDLLLFSTASTTGDGQSAQNFSQVSVTGTIPSPETLPLMVGGLAGMFVIRRKAAAKASNRVG